MSDEEASSGRAPVPVLLAVGAVHTPLVAAGLRTRSRSWCRPTTRGSRTTWRALLAFGAEAVFPRLALATVAAAARGTARGGVLPVAHSVEEGVLKVMAKSESRALDTYRGAQTFDAVGLAHDVVDAVLPGAVSPLGGLTFEDIAADVLERHAAAFPADPDAGLASPGFVKFHKGGEYHATNPDVVRALHRTVDPDLASLKSTAAGHGDSAGRSAAARRGHGARRTHSSARCARRATPSGTRGSRRWSTRGRPTELHDLLEFVPAGRAGAARRGRAGGEIAAALPTGAMSHGALSQEAHANAGAAMNLIGGRSNCGEGGEDRPGTAPRPGTRRRNSTIKQVASGRFGVTPEYLVVRRGAPDQDGPGLQAGRGRAAARPQGHGRDRPAPPHPARRALISPPPHHDIYSIEDLAQLIYDLKQVNPAADVSVKLVAGGGIGTIAAGVAKAAGRRRAHQRRPRAAPAPVAALLDQARRPAVGARPGRDAAGAGGTACAAACACAPTAASRPGATSWPRPCSARTSTRSARRS